MALRPGESTPIDPNVEALRLAQRKLALLDAAWRQFGRDNPDPALWAGARAERQRRVFAVAREINRLRALVYGDAARLTEPEREALFTRQYADKVTSIRDSSRDAELADAPELEPFPITRLADSDPLEDSGTYSETDPGTKITLDSATKVTHQAYQNESAWLSKDFGAGYFVNFTHRFEVRLTAQNNTTLGGAVQKATVSNHLNANPQDTAGICPRYDAGVAQWQVTLKHRLNTAEQTSDTYVGAQNTTYYIEESRSGSTLTAEIYSANDYAPGNLLDTLTIDDDGTARRYVLWTATLNNAASRYVTYYVENVNLFLPPTGVSASDGTSAQTVTVTWTDEGGGTTYNIQRDAVEIATGETGGTYTDYPPDTDSHDYTVTAVRSGIESQPSDADAGYRSAPAACPSEVETDLSSHLTASIDSTTNIAKAAGDGDASLTRVAKDLIGVRLALTGTLEFSGAGPALVEVIVRGTEG